MIKISAATTNPSATGKNTPKKVKTVQPKAKNTYTTADFNTGSRLANPSLNTITANTKIVPYSSHMPAAG